jgi:hypothetical protein
MKYFFRGIVTLLTIALFLVNVQAQQIDIQQNLTVVEAEAFGVTPPLRELKNLPPKQGQPRQIPLLKRMSPQSIQSDSKDPVVQESPGVQPMFATVPSVEGLSCDDNAAVHGFRLVPPDTEGDVGPNHYIQYINMIYAIYDKSGNMLVGPLGNYVMWQNLNLPPGVEPNGDPIVLYDHLADRWMMSEFAFPNSGAPSYQLIAVSQTPDPTGAWYTYAFKISDTKLNDYPKFGVWPDGYYASFNMFAAPSFFYSGPGVAVFERDQMLVGGPARMLYFESTDTDFFSLLPAELDGPPPPPGTPNYFVELEPDEWGFPQDQLGLFAFHVDWVNPANTTVTRLGALPTAPFDPNLCNYGRSCIPQKNSPDGLDAISDRLMYRLQYRNFGTHQTMVTNHTVDVGNDLAGVRWYEIRDEGNGWYIHQQGTYAPQYNGIYGGIHRWMGSIAMNGDGSIALGYSVSGPSIYPSIVATGRRAGDPLGTMLGEVIVYMGTGSQLDSYNRWGDYSTMSVDPSNDSTFIYTNEYYEATSQFDWKTRIGVLTVPTTTPVISNAQSFETMMSVASQIKPDRFALNQNYPNPFNPETWIPFKIAEPANVVLSIYDIHGQLVRKIELGEKPAGVYVSQDKAIHWDGLNQEGEAVSSGMYFYTLQANDYTETKRMLILK